MNDNDRRLPWLLGGLAAAAAVWLLLVTNRAPVPMPAPAPKPLVTPTPAPAPKCPNCPRPRPWASRGPAAAGQDGTRAPDIDLLALPDAKRRANIASKGAGCCVFRSLEYAAWWQNVPQLHGLPEWMVSKGIVGGGWPEKVAKLVPQISADRGMPAPPFVQYQGNDPSIIELALRTGRVPCVTWQANHMLCCVHLDAERAAIVDNNAPGRVQWFDRATFIKKWTAGGGGWCAVLLAAPPPPPPAGPKPRPVGRKKGCACSKKCSCGCNDGKPCGCNGRPEKDPLPKQPAPAPVRRDDAPPTGLDWVYGGNERYDLNGGEATRAQVEAALEDDSGKPHLTFIGGKEQRAAALAAAGDAPQRCLTQAYEPGDWALACGFAAHPEGTVYLQARDGAVLLRRDGAAGLAGLAEALRRADPSYRPEADPKGGPTLPLDLAGLKGYLPWLAGGGGLLALWALSRSKGGTAAASSPAPRPRPAAPRERTLDDVAREIGREILLRRAARAADAPDDVTAQPPR